MIETWRFFWLIMKRTHGDRLLYSFAAFYLIASVLFVFLDPNITDFGDALWLGFNIATSIGLGDFTVTTLSARIVAVLLGLYGAVIVAYIPGLIVSYYTEKTSVTRDETIEQHYDQIMDLHTMSAEEKRKLSEQIQKENKKK